MHRFYICQATRNGRQLPSFLLDGNTLGIINAGHAARIALDVLVGVTNNATLRFLREDTGGTLTATVLGTESLGQHSRQDGVQVQYVIHAAPAEDTQVTSNGPTERDFAAAGRLLQLAESGDPAINEGVIRGAARIAATSGSDEAWAFLDGVWYVQGNRRTDTFPYGAHETWRKARLALSGEAA